MCMRRCIRSASSKRRSLVVACLVSSSAAACASSGGGPLVSPTREVELGDYEGLAVGKAAVLAAAADGGFFVADAFHRRVVRYSSTGDALRSYGGPEDPFAIPTGLVALGDSLAVVVDHATRRIRVFDVETGAETRSLSYPDGTLVSRGEQLGDRIWFSAFKRGADSASAVPTGLMVWNMTTDGVAYLLEAPASYRQQPLAGLFSSVAFSIRQDSMIVGFAADRWLRIVNASGSPVDSVDIPSRRRRGLPADINRQLLEARVLPEQIKLVSLLTAVHTMSNGETVLVHQDNEVRPTGMAATVYVTLLTRSLLQACADRVIPSDPDDLPLTALVGDTLFVLRTVLRNGGRARSVISGFTVSGAGCRWTQMRPPGH